MSRLTKLSCAGPNYESMRTLSDSFITTSDPTGSEHQRIYSSLRKTELVSLCFHVRIQRGSRGSKSPGKLQCWGLKMKSCFLTDGPGPPPPPSVKIHGSTHDKHSVLITTAQYRVRDIGLPIKGLWASLRPLTCHLSRHFAYMKCHSLAYFYKRLSCCWMGKEEGTTHSKVYL